MQTQAPLDLSALLVDAFKYMTPEIILTAMACALLVLDVITPKSKKRLIAHVAIGGVFASAISLLVLWRSVGYGAPVTSFYEMFVVDGFALALKAIFLAAAALSIAISI